MSLQVSLHAPERVPCVRALTLADLRRPVCRYTSVLSPGTVRASNACRMLDPVCWTRTHTGWKEIALRKVQNTAEETRKAFPDAYEIIETAPEGTRVTDLLDVSGMLIRGGKGTGELSFYKVVLAGGFKASKSRIEVDVDFSVGRCFVFRGWLCAWMVPACLRARAARYQSCHHYHHVRYGGLACSAPACV